MSNQHCEFILRLVPFDENEKILSNFGATKLHIRIEYVYYPDSGLNNTPEHRGVELEALFVFSELTKTWVDASWLFSQLSEDTKSVMARHILRELNEREWP